MVVHNGVALLLASFMWDIAKNLWVNWGTTNFWASSLAAAVVGMLVWWIIGAVAYLSAPKNPAKAAQVSANNSQAMPRVGAVGIRNAGHVKMENVRVLDGDFIYESENTKEFEGKGLELTGRLSPSDRKLYDTAQSLVNRWLGLPKEEISRRAGIVDKEVARLRGKPDAAEQLEQEMEKQFPDTPPPK